VELLKEFKQQEERKALQTGGEPFDFGFLWRQLGLDESRS
jgi:hypothetical protein